MLSARHSTSKRPSLRLAARWDGLCWAGWSRCRQWLGAAGGWRWQLETLQASLWLNRKHATQLAHAASFIYTQVADPGSVLFNFQRQGLVMVDAAEGVSALLGACLLARWWWVLLSV